MLTPDWLARLDAYSWLVGRVGCLLLIGWQGWILTPDWLAGLDAQLLMVNFLLLCLPGEILGRSNWWLNMYKVASQYTTCMIFVIYLLFENFQSLVENWSLRRRLPELCWGDPMSISNFFYIVYIILLNSYPEPVLFTETEQSMCTSVWGEIRHKMDLEFHIIIQAFCYVPKNVFCS